jgi:surfactin synthase thioesterase subunit
MLNDLAAVIRSLPDELMRRHMAEVANTDCLKPFSKLRLPCLYLLASQDMIVSRKACQLMCKANPEMRTASISGPHFLLGARPKECAAEVQQFAKLL